MSRDWIFKIWHEMLGRDGLTNVDGCNTQLYLITLMAAEVDRIADIYCCFHPRPQVLNDRSNNLLNSMMEGGPRAKMVSIKTRAVGGGGGGGTRRAQLERTWQIAYIKKVMK